MLLIMCPKSRSGRGRKLWSRWLNLLDTAKVKYSCKHSQYPGHSTSLAGKSKDQTIVAAGGDGTINEVLNGICQSDISGKKLGVLYCGTSPDFCRFHKIPTDPDNAMECLLNGKSKNVDLINIQFTNNNNFRDNAYFACSCNIGFGAKVASMANKIRRYFGDRLGSFIAVIFAIITHNTYNLRINIDDSSHVLNNCNHLMLVKNTHIASGMKLDLDIQPDDGKAFVLAICNQSRIGLIKLLPKIYNGSIIFEKCIFLKQFTKINIQCDKEVEIEFDGDPKGLLPVSAEISPGKLELIGPYDA